MKNREQMILENMGLVGKIARKYTNQFYDYEDLFQVGCMGLVKAVDLFDESRGFKFSTLAWRIIRNEIFKYFRAQKKHEGCSSLNIIVSDEGNIELLDLLKDDLNIENDVIEGIRFQHYVDSLESTQFSEREKECMRYRAKGLSQMEIGQNIGLSQVAVSRCLSSAKRKVSEICSTN